MRCSLPNDNSLISLLNNKNTGLFLLYSSHNVSVSGTVYKCSLRFNIVDNKSLFLGGYCSV